MTCDPCKLESKCWEAASRLVTRYRWQLLGPEELAGQIVAQIRADDAVQPYRAALHIYSHALYRACSGDEGEQRQNLGYAELRQYLYACAQRRYPDVCDDATQQAIERMFVSFARCREPGAFLAVAIQYLADAVRQLRRQNAQSPESIVALMDDGQDVLDRLVADLDRTDPCAEVIDHERRAQVAACIAEFQHKHPRARGQITALWLKYIDGLDEGTISKALGTSVASTYVLRTRAIKKLQAEPSWQALAADFGIMPSRP